MRPLGGGEVTCQAGADHDDPDDNRSYRASNLFARPSAAANARARPEAIVQIHAEQTFVTLSARLLAIPETFSRNVFHQNS